MARFLEAIQYNHKDIVKILIENGADVNKVRMMVLHLSYWLFSITILKLLKYY